MGSKAGSIHIKGARVHNLKNIEVDIPHNQLVVITGLSGSGKSTLAFDTIFAEGQRRYVESLSAYARQFLGRIDKPEVDSITGIAPAIAIEQKVNTRNPRSTVGTTTEIYDYLKLLFARIGRIVSPVSGREVKMHNVRDVLDFILLQPEGTRIVLVAPIRLEAGQGIIEKLTLVLKEGIQRVWDGSRVVTIDELLPTLPLSGESPGELAAVIDRGRVANSEEFASRIGESIERAFAFGRGDCAVVVEGVADELTQAPFDEKRETEGVGLAPATFGKPKSQERAQPAVALRGVPGSSSAAPSIEGGAVPHIERFSASLEADGITFEEPSEHLFSFNNPLGACPRCEGFGKVIGIDEDLVIPDKGKTVFDDTIACWKGDTMRLWKDELVRNAPKFGFPIHKPYYELTAQEKRLLWSGNDWFHGLNDFFDYLARERYKVQYRVMMARYTGKTVCPECEGGRLRKTALAVRVGGLNISQMVSMPVEALYHFFVNFTPDKYEQQKAGRVLTELHNRLRYLIEVGLGYLTLDRPCSTLSGGESQRINLSTSLGSSLVGSLYILDEPSIGLHPRDTQNLVRVLRQLRDVGNTVIVVEHEEEIIRAADQIIDIGPLAGTGGGEVVYSGPLAGLEKAVGSLTADYIFGRKRIAPPDHVRRWNNYIEIKGARENNLKGIDVRIPLGIMTCVTGVSGSGKSSLIRNILYPALRRHLFDTGSKPGSFGSLGGDLHLVKSVEMVDQNPIGKSSRSNPVTYIKAYDEIRKLFADQPYAVHNGLQPSHFSFNIAGGRCEDCQGEGFVKISMQFMADVELRCDTCGGKRFKDEILEVTYNGKNIYDILEMSIDQAVEFFSAGDKGKSATSTCRRIVEKLTTLQDVGLGYVRLGQSSSTLSGGENQRVKLASFLLKENSIDPVIFIFDEPTTGLHFHDINKLMAAFNALIAKGHTVVVIEHNPEVIRCSDWVVDLGPEGGDKGGMIVFEGTPKELMDSKDSYTGRYLRKGRRGGL